MDITIFKDRSLNDFFTRSVSNAFNCVRGSRPCHVLSDCDFMVLNIWRTLSKAKSGRDFLQELGDCRYEILKQSTYFDALSSPRRLTMVQQVTDILNQDMRKTLTEIGVDYLEDFPSLKERIVVAGDGHAIEHACHAKRGENGKYVCETNIHLLDLHTGLGEYLTTVQGDGTHRHEIPSLRKSLLKWRKGLTKCKKPPILIYDRAAVDKKFWTNMTLAEKNGIYVITRCKSDMVFHVKANRKINSSLPINMGVISDEWVGQDNAIMMRRVHFCNPEDGCEYEFLTTETNLEPGLISWLYFMRWKIEKRFDTFKNKLCEKKGWATGKTAQEIQARICNCTHNLLEVLLKLFELTFGIQEYKLFEKRKKHLEDRKEEARINGQKVHVNHKVKNHLYQLSCQYIRIIKNLFFSQMSLIEHIPLIRMRLETYQ